MLAGRVGLGSVLGAPEDVSKIPANYRFFAGGVGSIRGLPRPERGSERAVRLHRWRS